MTELVEVNDVSRKDQGRGYCEQLEQGNILFFARIPFELPAEDRAFLLDQQQSDAAYHKNIAYRPGQARLSGFVKRTHGEEERLRTVMRSYSDRCTRHLSALLPRYAAEWKIDFASFRPQEEAGRQIRQRARNDLLHVDSFPTRPTNGDRILRFFSNINPSSPRVWLTGETFEELARRIRPLGQVRQSPAIRDHGRSETLEEAAVFLPQSHRSVVDRVAHSLLGIARSAGLPLADASPYDKFMHRFHNYLKQNQSFQDGCPKRRWEFPSNSSWMVFTDMVSHAVLSGRFALEQTYIVSRRSLALPHKAPATVLEEIVGSPVTLPR
jgi:hypothetical protein